MPPSESLRCGPSWYHSGGKSSMWTVDGTAEPRSKAQPLVGYYDSDNAEVVRWHIRLAKAAGIDAFLVSWWGGANISDRAFEKVILPVAAEEKFQVALCSELACASPGGFGRGDMTDLWLGRAGCASPPIFVLLVFVRNRFFYLILGAIRLPQYRELPWWRLQGSTCRNTALIHLPPGG
jgi:hypothetical protein